MAGVGLSKLEKILIASGIVLSVGSCGRFLYDDQKIRDRDATQSQLTYHTTTATLAIFGFGIGPILMVFPLLSNELKNCAKRLEESHIKYLKKRDY